MSAVEAPAHDAQAEDVIPGTSLTRAELHQRMARFSLEDRQKLARSIVRSRRHPHSDATKRRISEKLAALRRAQAEAAEYVHPLRRARLDANGGRGLTIKALADRALVDASTIQTVEATRHTPSPMTLARLARALSTTPDKLTP